MDRENRDQHSGLSSISRESGDVEKYYDDWASEYDMTLAEWRYSAPERVASILRTRLSQDSEIVDAGCGTGLSGRALRRAGFKVIDGIDISRESLEVAGRSGAYRTLQAVDMQQLPLPIPSNHYDGLVCVGVLTYLTDSMATLREFSRIVKPGGSIVITQRSDLFNERDFNNVLEQLVGEGCIGDLQISAPEPYLPENEEFGDRILVRYIWYTAAQ